MGRREKGRLGELLTDHSSNMADKVTEDLERNGNLLFSHSPSHFPVHSLGQLFRDDLQIIRDG